MIKAIFSLFQVQIERMFRYAIKLCHAPFGVAPKRLDTIDMPISIGKFIFTVMHPKVLIKTNVNQTIIPAPAIRVNQRIRRDTSSDNALQRSPGTIGHDFCLNLSVTFKQAKHNGFAISTYSTLASDAMSSKVRPIYFYRALKRRVLLTEFCQSLTNLEVNRIHRTNRNTNQFSGTAGSKIQSKTAHKLPEFSLFYFRTTVVSIFINHFRKLSHFNKCFAS